MSKKKKLAVIDLLFRWPPDGGARTDVKEVVSRLARDLEVCLFMPDFTRLFPRGEMRQEVGFPTRKIAFSTLTFNRFLVARRFRQALEEFQPDYTLITDGWYLKPSLIVALRRFQPVVRYYAYEGLCLLRHGLFVRRDALCHRNYLEGGMLDFMHCSRCAWGYFVRSQERFFIHEYLNAGAFWPGYGRLVKRALRSARAMVVYNSMIADRVKPYCSDVRLVPSGIDPQHFVPQPETGHQTPVVGMVGRISDHAKGFQFLLEATRSLHREGLGFQLWATSDSFADPIPDVFMFPWLTQEQLPELYAQMDICVVPSIWPEPFGIVALEAMASGRPVIVTKVGGLQNIVRDGVNGFVVEPGDVLALADRLKLLIRNPALRSQMGRAGRQIAAEHYNYDTIVDRYYRPLFPA